MGHLRDSIHINAPMDRVWAFTHDPRNWATYMVGLTGPDKTTVSWVFGALDEQRDRLHHIRETARLVEDLRDAEGGVHTRFDFEGSLPGWMAWDCKPEDEGTLVTVEEQYTVPGSVLGRVADRLIVGRMEERDIHHTLEDLKLLMEGSRAQV